MNISFISSDRIDELYSLWGSESSDPDTQEWREDLSESEASLVASWDKSFSLGVRCLCERILQQETVQAKTLQPELG